MWSNKSKKETQGDPIYSWYMWNMWNLLDNVKTGRPERRTALTNQRACSLQSWYSCTEWNRPSGCRTAQRMQLWLHFLLEWMQWWRTQSRVLDLRLSLRLCKYLQTCQRESQINWWLFNFLLGTKSAQQWSVHMHLPWLIQKRWRTGFMMNLIQASKLSPSQTNCFSSAILMSIVESDHHPWIGVIGSQGVRKCNSNGLLLLWLCSTYDLVIKNTLFCLLTCNKTSWMHLRSKHWHLIDYVITRKKDAKDIRVTRVMCGTDCWTDHRLFLSKIYLKIAHKRCPRGKKVFKKLDCVQIEAQTNCWGPP